MWRQIKRVFRLTWSRILGPGHERNPLDSESLSKLDPEVRDLFSPKPDFSRGSSRFGNIFGWILDSVMLGGIAVLFWMALGVVPGWIAKPVVAFWWGWVGFKFLLLGLPFFLVPLWLLWEAVRPGGKPEPNREYEEAEAEAARRLEDEPDIKAFGVIPGRIFLIMRRVLLLLGLLAAGRYLLAGLYIFPDVAFFILNQINRLRGALGGQQT